jgi:hypothetical protein
MTVSKTTFTQAQTHSAPGALMFAPMKSAAYIAMADTLRITGSEKSLEETLTEAAYRHIAYLMGEDEPESKSTNDGLKSSSSGGCAWDYKNIHIPFDGAKFRMFYKGKYEYFEAVNGKFHYEGKDYDEPGAVVKAITGTNRNAWRDVWAMREGDEDWIRADELRKDPAYVQPEVMSKPPLSFSLAVEAIAELRKLGFPEVERNLFFPLHHMNMDGTGRYNIPMKEFERYAGLHTRTAFDGNNGKVIRRLRWLVENYAGEKAEAEWESLIQKAVVALPHETKE